VGDFKNIAVVADEVLLGKPGPKFRVR